MKILALESSAKAASCAVLEDGILIAQYFQSSGLTHSRTLMPMVEDMLKNLEINLDDIDLIAVAKGPGSFTGIRIGVAAVKGMAWASGKPVCGVSTLEAMASQVMWWHGVICPVMDARRNQVYNGKFEVRDGKLVRLCDDRALSVEELENEIKGSEKPYLFVGDGALLCYNCLKTKEYNISIAPENLRLQTAYGVGCVAQNNTGDSGEKLVPSYLRLSQAERERIEKLKKI